MRSATVRAITRRLEAYDAANNLLARHTTSVLASGQVESMVIERATPEIAYVIAKGHAGSDVLLDNLKYGRRPPRSPARSANMRWTTCRPERTRSERFRRRVSWRRAPCRRISRSRSRPAPFSRTSTSRPRESTTRGRTP